MEEDIEIIEREFKEFVFDEYSIIYDVKDKDWSLKYYDEEYGETIISIDDYSFEEEKELFEVLEFDQIKFNKIKDFINANS